MTKLFVGNVSYRVSEMDLGNWFQQWGVSTASVTLLKDPEGQNRGFGFVKIMDEDAELALSLNGKMLAERFLKIAIAKERTKEREVNEEEGATWKRQMEFSRDARTRRRKR